MDWLIHNSIADIHGPAFLIVYIEIAVVTVLLAYAVVLLCDKTRLRAPPPVPSTFDPYELSYLRGGKNAVIRTALYSLHQLSLVDPTPRAWFTDSKLVVKADLADGKALSGLEERVLRSLRSLGSPVKVSDLFKSDALGTDVEALCEPFRNRLESDELLFRPDTSRLGAMLIVFAATAVLVLLSLWRIATAEGRPVGFLFWLTVVAVLILWKVVWPHVRTRITARGKAYLKQLQLAYENLRQPAGRGTGTSSQPDLAGVALVALFGIGILSGTADDAFARLFTRASRNAGCGGSTGCGGGGCGGGGGGGGGGGCGGGGCGG
jgi:uncharacterized protein (TIGR04222 family)